MDLADMCYSLTKLFPKEELFGMTSQIRRCAISIPSNIAEGYGRGNYRELNHFLRISRGSLSELETQLLLCQRVGLLSVEQRDSTLVILDEVGRILRGLQKTVGAAIR